MIKPIKSLLFLTIVPAVSAFCAVTWNTPVTVDFQLDNLETPNVAINDAGQIIAIWNFEGSNEDYVSHATWQGQTWTPSFALANQDDSKWFPMVHVDAQGRGVALIPDGSNPVYQATYDGISWTPASIIPGAVFEEVTPVQSPSLAGTSSGKAVGTWIDATTNSIQYSTFTWPAFAAAITHGTTGDHEAPPRVSMNDSEFGELAWGATGLASMMASPYVSATGAFTPDGTVSTGVGTHEAPAVDVNASGQAVIAWYDFSTGDSISAAIYNGTAWSAPVTLVTPPSFEDRTLRVKMDENGNALAVWQEAIGGGSPGTLYSSYYSAATGLWGTPVVVANNVYSDSSFANLTLGFDMHSSSGNAVVVFFGIDTSIANGMFVLGSVFDATTQTWESPQTLDQATALVMGSDPVLVASAAVNSSGQTVVVWSRVAPGAGSINYVRSAFTFIGSPGPLGLVAHARKNRFPTQTEYYTALDWNRAVQETVVGYQLFRDDVLIANLSGSANSYIDRGRVKGQRVVYTLVASSGDGLTTSSTVTVN